MIDGDGMTHWEHIKMMLFACMLTLVAEIVMALAMLGNPMDGARGAIWLAGIAVTVFVAVRAVAGRTPPYAATWTMTGCVAAQMVAWIGMHRI